MLDNARNRDGGRQVTWTLADARGLDLGARFDTVLIIGHAFQTLLTSGDRGSVLAAIACHLAPDGRFVCDSRNPEAREWESSSEAATRKTRAHPECGQVERWNTADWAADRGVVTYETHDRLPSGDAFFARSEIAFPGFGELEALLGAAGLRVARWFGDPQGGPLRPGCPDFISVGGLA